MTLKPWHQTFPKRTRLFAFTLLAFGFTQTCKAELKPVKPPTAFAVRGAVMQTIFSPDGASVLILAAVSDALGHATIARLYHVKTGKIVRNFRIANSNTVAVAISPDGSKVATGQDDDTVYVWNTKKRQPLYRFGVAYNPKNPKLIEVQSVAFASSHRLIVAKRAADEQGSRGVLETRSASNGKLIRTRVLPDFSVQNSALSSNGSSMISETDDSSPVIGEEKRKKNRWAFRVWNTTTATPRSRFAINSPDGEEPFCELSTDGKMVACYTWRGRWITPMNLKVTGVLQLRDARTGKLLRRWGRLEATLPSMAFSGDGRILAIGSKDIVRLHSTRTGRVLRNFRVGRLFGGSVLSVAISPDGKLLLCGYLYRKNEKQVTRVISYRLD